MRYALGRVVQSLVLLVAVSLVTFALVHRAPGGPAILDDPMLTRDQAAQMARTLELDRPVHQQYARWASRVLRGQWGISFNANRPVLDVIGERLPATLMLSGTALVIALTLSVPLGVVSAARRNSRLDRVVTAGSMFGLSVPAFWLGIMLILVFAVFLRWLPAGGIVTIGGAGGVVDRLRHLALPAAVLALFALAQLTRYVRAGVIAALREDYVRTARAKGLADSAVLFRHALRNALLPMVTVVGTMLPQLVGGAAITETVFSWPGMGRLAIEAAAQRDYPLVMGITMLVSLLVVTANLAVDLLYGVLDPRIRLR